MYFRASKLSGSRLIGAMTILGELGPKHHGLIIGENIYDEKIYVAESVGNGYQYVTIEEFVARYKLNGKIKYFRNDGGLSAFEVAKRAVEEINKGGNAKYDLLSNNCESFVNRAMYGKSISSQVFNTVSVVLLIVGVGLFFCKGSKAV